MRHHIKLVKIMEGGVATTEIQKNMVKAIKVFVFMSKMVLETR